jgi:putative selenate reductase
LPAASLSDARIANTETYAPVATQDARYRRRRNEETPRKVGRTLSLFDCLACDKCVSACPNGANFVFHPPADRIHEVRLVRAGTGWTRRTTGSLATSKPRQIAHFADFCNECGNCDVFCPEDGGPYKAKPRFFATLRGWTDSGQDGFYATKDGDADVVFARFGGREHLLTVIDGMAICDADGLHVSFPAGVPEGSVEGDAAGETDLTPFFIMDALRQALLSPEAVNHVNA